MTLHSVKHPDPATLVSYAAGSLPEPLAAAVAAHLSMCADCQDEVADMELLGATLLLATAPTAVDVCDAPLTPHDKVAAPGDARADRVAARNGVSHCDRLPAPLVAAYGVTFDTIPWRRLAPGVWHHRLPLSAGAEGDLRLLKINPGQVMPDHGHGGSELTLVIDGAYSDETGRYCRGDVQDVDEAIEHTPVADKDTGCVCLVASERPARFKTLFGRLMQPWTGL